MYVLDDIRQSTGFRESQVPVTAAIWKGGLQPLGLVLGGVTVVGLD